jgi:hypothetical protein
LADFAHKNGSYPKSLEDLEKQDEADRDERASYVRSLEGHFQYRKVDGGFRLSLLGPGGKPSGAELDGDLGSEPAGRLSVAPTLSQFLLDSVGSTTLFNVALLASFCAGLACYLSTGPRQRPVSRIGVLLSVVVMSAAALGVSLFLTAFYLQILGSHH